MSKRPERVSDLVKAALSEIILKEVRDPRIGSITITSVKMSEDLRSAKVFFVRMGTDESSGEVQEQLQRASGFLKRGLGKRLEIRFIPELTFIYDRSFEYGEKIEKLLSEIRDEVRHDDGSDN